MWASPSDTPTSPGSKTLKLSIPAFNVNIFAFSTEFQSLVARYTVTATTSWLLESVSDNPSSNTYTIKLLNHE